MPGRAAGVEVSKKTVFVKFDIRQNKNKKPKNEILRPVLVVQHICKTDLRFVTFLYVTYLTAANHPTNLVIRSVSPCFDISGHQGVLAKKSGYLLYGTEQW